MADVAQVRHVGQRMGPVFEYAAVDRLRLPQMRRGVGGDAGEEDVVGERSMTLMVSICT